MKKGAERSVIKKDVIVLRNMKGKKKWRDARLKDKAAEDKASVRGRGMKSS